MGLHIAWSDGDSHDITLSGIKGSRSTISEDSVTAFQVLQFLKPVESSIPNTEMV